MPIIESVQAQSVAIHEALNLSIANASDGYLFATDMEELCSALLNPKYPKSEVKEMVEQLRAKTETAMEGAKIISSKFSDIRQELYRVCPLT